MPYGPTQEKWIDLSTSPLGKPGKPPGCARRVAGKILYKEHGPMRSGVCKDKDVSGKMFNMDICGKGSSDVSWCYEAGQMLITTKKIAGDLRLGSPHP